LHPRPANGRIGVHICVKERRMKLLVAAFSVLIVLGSSTSVRAAGADVRRNACNGRGRDRRGAVQPRGYPL